MSGNSPDEAFRRLSGAARFAADFVKAHWPRLLATAVLATVLLGNQGFISLVRNWRELRRLRAELGDLDRQEAALSERLRRLRSGDAALERTARKELGYVKKGEVEYRFKPPEPEDAKEGQGPP